jgi:large subunit ribosomal protein L15
VFNLGQIESLVEKYGISDFNFDTLYSNGLVGKTDKIKILGNGELKAKLAFRVNAVSEKAKTAIEGAGGSVELLVK